MLATDLLDILQSYVYNFVGSNSSALWELLMQPCFPQRELGELRAEKAGVIWILYGGAESAGIWLHKSN